MYSKYRLEPSWLVAECIIYSTFFIKNPESPVKLYRSLCGKFVVKLTNFN